MSRNNDPRVIKTTEGEYYQKSIFDADIYREALDAAIPVRDIAERIEELRMNVIEISVLKPQTPVQMLIDLLELADQMKHRTDIIIMVLDFLEILFSKRMLSVDSNALRQHAASFSEITSKREMERLLPHFRGESIAIYIRDVKNHRMNDENAEQNYFIVCRAILECANVVVDHQHYYSQFFLSEIAKILDTMESEVWF